MTYLRLAVDFEDESALTFVISTSSLMKGAGGSSGKVRIIERDAFGLPHETHDYELSNDETVVSRIDVGDETMRRFNKEPGIVRVIGADEEKDSPLYDAVANFRLEEQFGTNNQPVGIAEIEKLRALLNLAQPDID